MTNIEVNGESMTVASDLSLQGLLSRLGLDAAVTVAEINGIILSREDFDSTVLKEEDRVELIRFMGGGARRVLEFGIYPVITEAFCAGRTSLEVLDQVLSGGARIVQLREKGMNRRDHYRLARAYRDKTAACGAALIINDAVDLALAVEADGVHLGQEDLPCEAARRLAPGLILGLSTHSASEIEAAKAQGADWINIGPLFATATKETPGVPLGVSFLDQVRSSLPWSVMGGIKEQHLPQLISKGVRTVAMVTEITQDTAIPEKVRRMQQLFKAES